MNLTVAWNDLTWVWDEMINDIWLYVYDIYIHIIYINMIWWYMIDYMIFTLTLMIHDANHTVAAIELDLDMNWMIWYGLIWCYGSASKRWHQRAGCTSMHQQPSAPAQKRTKPLSHQGRSGPHVSSHVNISMSTILVMVLGPEFCFLFVDWTVLWYDVLKRTTSVSRLPSLKDKVMTAQLQEACGPGPWWNERLQHTQIFLLPANMIW